MTPGGGTRPPAPRVRTAAPAPNRKARREQGFDPLRIHWGRKCRKASVPIRPSRPRRTGGDNHEAAFLVPRRRRDRGPGRYLETIYGVRATSAQVVGPEVEPDLVVDAETVPTVFEVVLDGIDAARRVAVIKAVREAKGLGLKEARDLVDACPKVLQHRLPRGDAERLQAELRAAGAKASVRSP